MQELLWLVMMSRWLHTHANVMFLSPSNAAMIIIQDKIQRTDEF